MFGKWSERGKTPIGIDFGARSVRAVQLTAQGDRWRVSAAGVAALGAQVPDSGVEHAKAVAEALVRVLESTSFSGKRVVTALPSSAVQCKNLRLPPMPPNELQAAVEWEAADRLKLGQTYQIQFFDAGEVRQGEDLRQEIILLAAPTATIEQHVNLLVACGLEPEAIDVDASALARCALDCVHTNSEQVQLVLDLGVSGSNVLISKQGRVMFFKRIDIGGKHVEDAIAKQFNMSTAEASNILVQRAMGTATGDASLVGLTRKENAVQAISDAVRPVLTDLCREVGLCLRYQGVTFRGQRATSALLTGGGSRDPMLGEILARETGLAVEMLDTAGTFDWSGVDESTLALCPTHSWAVALGLALRSEHRAAMKEAA